MQCYIKTISAKTINRIRLAPAEAVDKYLLFRNDTLILFTVLPDCKQYKCVVAHFVDLKKVFKTALANWFKVSLQEDACRESIHQNVRRSYVSLILRETKTLALLSLQKLKGVYSHKTRFYISMRSGFVAIIFRLWEFFRQAIFHAKTRHRHYRTDLADGYRFGDNNSTSQ